MKMAALRQETAFFCLSSFCHALFLKIKRQKNGGQKHKAWVSSEAAALRQKWVLFFCLPSFCLPFFSQGSEPLLKRAFWYIAKALQALGLIIVLVGILTGLSNPLGDAEFRAETRSAIIGVVVFGVGWLIEKKLAD